MSRGSPHPQSNLNNPLLTTILFAIMVKRLGGQVLITQSDIDDIAYSKMFEEGFSDGSLKFFLAPRGLAS